MDDEEATARALASIEETLQNFSSPMVGDLSRKQQQQSASYNYKMGAMEWMQHELTSNHNQEREASMLPAETPKRTPMMERAGTPIMSNSSRSNLMGSQTKQPPPGSGRSKYSLDDSDSDSDQDMLPLPVQTPLQRKFKVVSTPAKGSGRSISATSTTTTASSISLKQSVFRRHHDALWDYLVAKRSLETRMSLERKERELEDASNRSKDSSTNIFSAMSMDTADMSAYAISESLSKQESKTEVDFCKSLCHIGYGLTAMLDDSNASANHHEGPMEEGHFWELLATLRKLGLLALIWDDDPTSATQNISSQTFFLQQLASQANATPKELVEALSSSNNSSSSQPLPLALERKEHLLQWIQSCLELESKEIKAKLPPAKSNQVLPPSHPDDPNLPSLVSEMDSTLLKNTAQVCLALFLEGKNAEALEVFRSRGLFSKAAMYKGGEPYGYSTKIRDDTQTVEDLAVGNPNRFLWKRQVWKTGKKLLLMHSSQQQPQSQFQFGRQPPPPQLLSPTGLEEAAICSILSDDVQTALDNPCIRSSWTRSLCVLLKGFRGRLEDEVLHKHNSYKRRSGTCFAGYQYEQQENEQLMSTSKLGTMNEAQMAAKLSQSLFLDQPQNNVQQQTRKISYKKAIMAFVVGKSAILEFCDAETSRMVNELEKVRQNGESDNDDEYIHQDWEGVRFLTHLTLFLDSLQSSSTPMVFHKIVEQKNAILFQYVQYLESRPDLWHMITLYMGLLPENLILNYFPTVLAKVLNDSERQIMTGQIRDLMPSLELPLLRKVVRLSLESTEKDAIKCNSLQWLLHKDEHLEDALICSNILLREFFLTEDEDKTGVAMAFLSDSLPENFLDLVKLAIDSREESSSSNDSNESADRTTKVNNAFAEHMAYISYLEAYETYQTWRETLKITPTSSLGESHHRPNYSNLNETEKAIADSSLQRTWVKEKKQHLETTLQAAEEARRAWHTVLTHDGGWLAVDEDEDDHGDATSPTTAMEARFEDPEEVDRKKDIRNIRSRHLVLVANLYHQVCEETAAWLSKSLHEAQEVFSSKEEFLHKLRFGGSNADSLVTPEYWYQHSLDLATLVASDEHGIRKAFPPSDLKELITKLAETAVSKLMNV